MLYKHKTLCKHRGRIVEVYGRKTPDVYLAGSTRDAPLVVLHLSDRIA